MPLTPAANTPLSRSHQNGRPRGDGTMQLLVSGGLILATGIIAALLAKTVLGGIGIHGPVTSAGWLALMIALMCLPFGLMLFVLGAAKWMRHRRREGH